MSLLLLLVVVVVGCWLVVVLLLLWLLAVTAMVLGIGGGDCGGTTACQPEKKFDCSWTYFATDTNSLTYLIYNLPSASFLMTSPPFVLSMLSIGYSTTIPSVAN